MLAENNNLVTVKYYQSRLGLVNHVTFKRSQIWNPQAPWGSSTRFMLSSGLFPSFSLTQASLLLFKWQTSESTTSDTHCLLEFQPYTPLTTVFHTACFSLVLTQEARQRCSVLSEASVNAKGFQVRPWYGVRGQGAWPSRTSCFLWLTSQSLPPLLKESYFVWGEVARHVE